MDNQKKTKKVKGWVVITNKNTIFGVATNKKEAIQFRASLVFWKDFDSDELSIVPCEITYKI
jgi:hypothetical protein